METSSKKDRIQARGSRPHTPTSGTHARINSRAAELFFRNGYEGTSMRHLARCVGIQPSSLYGHVKSKQELLFRVMDRLMTEVLRRAHEALSGVDEPAAQVRQLVISNICQPGPSETALLQAELKNLSPRFRGRIERQQREYRELWISVLREGASRGIFTIEDPSLVFLAIDGALTHVERWFDPQGPLKRSEIAEILANWVLSSLNCRR